MNWYKNKYAEDKKDDPYVERGEQGQIIDSKTGEVLFSTSKGDSVKDRFEQNVVFDGSEWVKHFNRSIIVSHTHPDMSQASADDMAILGWSHVEKMRIIAVDGTIYEYTKPEGFKLTRRQIMELWNKVDEELDAQGLLKAMSVEEYIAEINRIFCQRTGIIFRTFGNK